MNVGSKNTLLVGWDGAFRRSRFGDFLIMARTRDFRAATQRRIDAKGN